MRRLLVAAGCWTLAATPALAANLIVNGGFEAAPLAAGAYLQINGGSGLAGWQVGGANIDLVDTGYAEGSPALTFHAHGGTTSVDLTGTGNTGTSNRLSQVVATTAGTTYRLSFWVGNADATGSVQPYYALPSRVGLAVDGLQVGGFINGAVTPNAVNWRKASTLVTAAGPTTTVTFINDTPVPDNYAGLDDVTLSAVPEPASWALMLVGLMLVGRQLRRRSLALAA